MIDVSLPQSSSFGSMKQFMDISTTPSIARTANMSLNPLRSHLSRLINFKPAAKAGFSLHIQTFCPPRRRAGKMTGYTIFSDRQS